MKGDSPCQLHPPAPPILPFGQKYHQVGCVLQPGGAPSEIPLCPPKFLTAHNSKFKMVHPMLSY